MADHFRVAIIGAGPGGLSAAARAAELGLSHILLEAAPQLAHTIHRYPRGKQVMAEPARLPLRSTLQFAPGTREALLAQWQSQIAALKVNLHTDTEVCELNKEGAYFILTLRTGKTLIAECVVLAIGTQGNLRRLDAPGADSPAVDYQLDDPAAFQGKTIVVIGAGDSGVENALALCRDNSVILINRQEEFRQCGDANQQALQEAMAQNRIEALQGAVVERVTDNLSHDDMPWAVHLRFLDNSQRIINCHQMIARLGTLPPRTVLSRFGVTFPSDAPEATPLLSENHETTLPGLYVIGAVSGQALIKQAVNQGFEVIEHLRGAPTEPADQSLLQSKFRLLPGQPTVAEGLRHLQQQHSLLALIPGSKLRELLVDSDFHTPSSGEIVFKQDDYSNTFFCILQGSVRIQIQQKDGHSAEFTLQAGQFFGEIGLLSGRRRSGTVFAGADCCLLEISRRTMLRLMVAVPAVQKRLDDVSCKRLLRNCYGQKLEEAQLDALLAQARPRRYAAGEVVFREGDPADALYIIRRGAVTVSRQRDGKEEVLAYVPAGNYVGEMGLVSHMPRSATITTASLTDMLCIDAACFQSLLAENADVRREVDRRYLERIQANATVDAREKTNLVQFLLAQGGGEGTDILLIDYARCIRCDNCERACADVHDGTSRLRRAAGQTYEMLHVPASCRHCEHPACMKQCPADAIHRSVSGETFIDDNCIGCGHCEADCPYGVIQMAVRQPHYHRPSLWQLLFRRPPENPLSHAEGAKKAVKCDMCRGIIGGAACIRACPTGAAFRVRPEQFIAMCQKS